MKLRAGVRALCALGSVSVMALAAAPAAPGQATRDCYWQGGSGATNIAYPDTGARYWVSAVALPPGREITLRGRFPHARYMSFNVYDAAAQPVDALPDVAIAPDPGSANPYLPGARRDVAARNYTVKVVAGPRPAQRAQNTIYMGDGAGTVGGTIIFRVYVPDLGSDPQPPDASMEVAPGLTVSSPIRCQPRDSASAAVNDLHAQTSGPGIDPANPVAENPIRWEAFFNYLQAYSYPLGATPLASARAVVPRERLGGFLSNVDNAYTFALANRGIAPVLVLTGRAPTTPRTRAGALTMDADVQVRYWSLCENELASQRVIECIFDEDVAQDDEGHFTVVVSTPADRPANARPECGVNWLPWGVQPDGFVILRHMLPSPSFAQAIQNVAAVGDERSVMGDYLPLGVHMQTAEFESRGCPSAGG
ncbi:MAG TPA: hypothetical protein VNT32_15035 [Thermoleophilaceae bacterium]|nr:hypothetical protein [Thermoleophilaceae bacterium]